MEEPKKDNNNHRKKSLLWWGSIALLVIVLIVVGVTYFNRPSVTQSESRINNVLENPEMYYGNEVTLTGEVAAIIGSQAFTIDAPQPLSEKLLVISKQPLQPIGGSGTESYLFNENDRISVTGTVKKFNIRKFEKELNADLVDNTFVNWQGKPAVIAESVERER